MPDIDIVIDPVNPTPTPPTPTPPAPQPGMTAAKLKEELAVALKVLHGIDALLPASVKVTADKVLGVLDAAAGNDFLLGLAAPVINKMTGKKATPDRVEAALREALAETP